MEGSLWLTVLSQNTVHHGRKVLVAGARGSWSQRTGIQAAERDELWCVTPFSLVQFGDLSLWSVVVHTQGVSFLLS